MGFNSAFKGVTYKYSAFCAVGRTISTAHSLSVIGRHLKRYLSFTLSVISKVSRSCCLLVYL